MIDMRITYSSIIITQAISSSLHSKLRRENSVSKAIISRINTISLDMLAKIMRISHSLN